MADTPGIVIPDLRGKSVLITGASTGIGAAAARAFGRNGAKVAIGFNASRDEAERVAVNVRAAGGEALLVGGDVNRPETAARAVAETAQAFGRLDVLVNNAGALIKRTSVYDYTDEFLEALLNLNVKQVVRFMREGAAQMRRQGEGGAIINVSSIAARHGGGPGSVIYAAAKGFVATATRGWAKELVKDRIRVNAVSPGVIMTPFHERFSTAEQLGAMQATIPMNRLGTPEECEGAFLYLASERLSGYVTGQIVEVTAVSTCLEARSRHPGLSEPGANRRPHQGCFTLTTRPSAADCRIASISTWKRVASRPSDPDLGQWRRESP